LYITWKVETKTCLALSDDWSLFVWDHNVVGWMYVKFAAYETLSHKRLYMQLTSEVIPTRNNGNFTWQASRHTLNMKWRVTCLLVLLGEWVSTCLKQDKLSSLMLFLMSVTQLHKKGKFMTKSKAEEFQRNDEVMEIF
jgi:hypothetical protein